MYNYNKILKLISAFVKTKNKQIKSINKNSNFILEEILDSMSFLELIFFLEKKLKIDIDFSDMEPEEFTTFHKLSKIISYFLLVVNI